MQYCICYTHCSDNWYCTSMDHGNATSLYFSLVIGFLYPNLFRFRFKIHLLCMLLTEKCHHINCVTSYTWKHNSDAQQVGVIVSFNCPLVGLVLFFAFTSWFHYVILILSLHKSQHEISYNGTSIRTEKAEGKPLNQI